MRAIREERGTSWHQVGAAAMISKWIRRGVPPEVKYFHTGYARTPRVVCRGDANLPAVPAALAWPTANATKDSASLAAAGRAGIAVQPQAELAIFDGHSAHPSVVPEPTVTASRFEP